MRHEVKLFQAYCKNPVEGITATIISGEENGIQFKAEYPPCTCINVYTDGSIRIPGYYPRTLGLVMQRIEQDDPKLFKLVRTVANDFKILELKENCPESLLLENRYSEQAVNAKLRIWEKETGRVVYLDANQKDDFYKEVISSESAITVPQITGWLQDNNISYLKTGHVTITIDSDKREISLYAVIDNCDNAGTCHTCTFKIDENGGLDKQLENALNGIYQLLEYHPAI